MFTMLTAACDWSSHYMPVQTFMSVSAELNHDRSPWVLDSDKGVCAVTTPLHSLQYIRDRKLKLLRGPNEDL